jgi:hypothetical protein
MWLESGRYCATRCQPLRRHQRSYQGGQTRAGAGLRFAPHSWCDPVAVISNAHVVASHGNGITAEIDQTGNRFIEELLGYPLTVNDGMLELGNRPGLGIELDPAAIKRFRVASPSDIPDGNHSDIILLGAPTVLQPIPPYVGPGEND